ncbi:sepiapterin reductase-like [Eurosta solidaginis]|uniref:sepiapterin reductase-like n=1 Tax=Eurosta solidaginis TaxID=178769 RepID=UPI0035306794
MSSKRADLSKRTFFILSGVSNGLAKSMATEMCQNFSEGSVVLLMDRSEESLQEVKKEIEYLERDINIICWLVNSWQEASHDYFRCGLAYILHKYATTKYEFELAFILHNEGNISTHTLVEPQSAADWLSFVQEHLNVPVALNQAFLTAPQFSKTAKLVVNITSTLMIRPFIYGSLLCSCMKSRDMYFRSMANEKNGNNVNVISYSPGILDSHKPQTDLNYNTVDLLDLKLSEKMLKLPRVDVQQSSLKLLNILEEMSFISGHEVDYYDTFNL